jgi:hypothetical protein
VKTVDRLEGFLHGNEDIRLRKPQPVFPGREQKLSKSVVDQILNIDFLSSKTNQNECPTWEKRTAD